MMENVESSHASRIWICQVCGYAYHEAMGEPHDHIPPHTAFEAIDAEWVCPACGVGKDQFRLRDFPLASH